MLLDTFHHHSKAFRNLAGLRPGAKCPSDPPPSVQRWGFLLKCCFVFISGFVL